MNLHKSTGILRYSRSESGGYRLVMEIDKELSRFYRSLMPKWITLNSQRYPPHVTIVRAEKEVPLHLEHWGKYEGEEIDFIYHNEVHCGKVYFWLNVFCVRLEEIREELGLPVISEFTLPPEGFVKCFHATLGNFKNLVV
jgi:hypothetical protein